MNPGPTPVEIPLRRCPACSHDIPEATPADACPMCAQIARRAEEFERRRVARLLHRKALGLRPLEVARCRLWWSLASAEEAAADVAAFADPADAPAAERAAELVHRAASVVQGLRVR